MDRKQSKATAFEPHPLRSLLSGKAADCPELLLSDDRETLPFFRIRAADSSGERSSASILIDKMYATRGYMTTKLPEQTPNLLTLVASDHHATIGTLTVGFDCGDGLLVDELFPDEVDQLRCSGRTVCEFTKLAIDSVILSKRVLAALFNVAYIYAHRIKGADNLLIEVNPRHVRYYRAMLGFTVIGPKRLNRRVNAPAVLLSLDLEYCRRQIELLGGHPEMSDTVRSLYPFSFSPREEAGIIGRLRRTEVEMTQVFGVEPTASPLSPAASLTGMPANVADASLRVSQAKAFRLADTRRAMV